MGQLNYPKDTSHELGLGSLGGNPLQMQPEVDHDSQGRPTPRSLAAAVDNSPSAATQITYPTKDKVRFIYDGNNLTVKQCVADARNWVAKEIYAKIGNKITLDNIKEKLNIVGVENMINRTVVTVRSPINFLDD